jgi:hypothetical protein
VETLGGGITEEPSRAAPLYHPDVLAELLAAEGGGVGPTLSPEYRRTAVFGGVNNNWLALGRCLGD